MIDQLLEQIPAHVHLLVAIAFASGTVIWAFGHRLLRPMIVLAGMVAGGAIGFVASGYIPETIPYWVPVLGGAMALGVIAFGAYRFMMSWMLAVCLGLACPLAFYTYTEITGHYAGQSGEPISEEELLLDLGPSEGEGAGEAFEGEGDAFDFTADDLRKETERKAREVIDDLFKRHTGRGDDPDGDEGEGEDGASGESGGGSEAEGDGDPSNNTAGEMFETWRQGLRDTIASILETAEARWKDAPAGQKWGLIVAAIAGVLGGFFAGILLPSASAAIVTAFSGGLMMLVSGFWLMTRLALPFETIQPESATASLVWWLAVSIVGLAIQLVFRERRGVGGKKASP